LLSLSILCHKILKYTAVIIAIEAATATLKLMKVFVVFLFLRQYLLPDYYHMEIKDWLPFSLFPLRDSTIPYLPYLHNTRLITSMSPIFGWDSYRTLDVVYSFIIFTIIIFVVNGTIVALLPPVIAQI
jgi:hypothetical protein